MTFPKKHWLGAVSVDRRFAVPALADEQADQHWKLLSNSCEKCHNTTDWAGGVAFDTMTPDTIADDAETWEKAVRKLRGRLMPPPGKPQPSNEAHLRLRELDGGQARCGRCGTAVARHAWVCIG